MLNSCLMSTLTFPILHLLADGQFHSGQALAQRFNVTRATIWNALQHAESLGVVIFSVRGRGYKLPHAINLLDINVISQAIGEQRAWFKLELLDEVPSTNTYLIQNKQAAHATCVAAHMQTQGKGRRGRTWVSQLGASLTFSLLWQFAGGAAGLSGLSLAVGVALIRALHELGVHQAELKWPNDVLIEGKKLAGILIELQGDLEGPSTAVIGVGINLNLPKNVLQCIDQPAIDLAHVASNPINQSALLGRILKHLADVLSMFEAQGFIAVRDEWLRYHAYKNKPVRMLLPNGTITIGTVTGVADDGILMVETALGQQRFSAGEISLRGVS
jgi:BirA family biotin operon repressor/biotin-[acetyl-CoA-carboxylase] ligase